MTTDLARLRNDARPWALRTLKLQSVDRQDVSAVLGFVTQSGYLLSIDQLNAAQIVSSGSQISDSDLQQCSTEALCRDCRHAVDEFCVRFIEYSHDTRLERWNELSVRCAPYPEIAAKLARLQPALDVSFPVGESVPGIETLTRLCFQAFIASPLRAAQMRRQFADQWRNDVETWENVVDSVVERYPQLLQTIAPWVDRLGDELFWDRQEHPPIVKPVPSVDNDRERRGPANEWEFRFRPIDKDQERREPANDWKFRFQQPAEPVPDKSQNRPLGFWWWLPFVLFLSAAANLIHQLFFARERVVPLRNDLHFPSRSV